jgi:peptidyl-tRNA hydrolase, PTH1 family
MWLIVGLGNPGAKYLLTRHNVGFMALDFLAKSVGVRNNDARSEFDAQTIDFKWDSEPVKLVKPQTFMNLSGESVGELSRFYKVPNDRVVIVHDELDLPFGQIRLKTSGGDGGHNGLKSLIQHLGGNDFLRLRIGVGRPPQPGPDAAAYVLQNFTNQEQEALPEILNRATDAIEAVVFDGVLKAMNTFNGQKTEQKSEGIAAAFTSLIPKKKD